jgi:hypothetical protein
VPVVVWYGLDWRVETIGMIAMLAAVAKQDRRVVVALAALLASLFWVSLEHPWINDKITE